MTEPSQYFKGRTVQEQMNEVIGYVDVRSAEVATDAIAADVAQVHQDMLDADADATAAAASAAAAAGPLANAVKKTGEASQSIAGDIAVAGTLSGGVVTGTQVTVPTPVNNTDAATKKYVDDADALLVPISNINQYAVGLTGNQDPIAGQKTFTGNIGVKAQFGRYLFKMTDVDITNPSDMQDRGNIRWLDMNDVEIGSLRFNITADGRTFIQAKVRNSDGSNKYVILAGGDII